MTDQELRIARLSKIMNSGLRVPSRHNKANLEAYGRVINGLEKRIQEEQEFNKNQERKQRLLEMAEREQELLRDSIYKHHFSVLHRQIDEKKRNKMIEQKEEIVEKELSEETYKPKKYNIKEMLDAQVEEKRQIKQDLKAREDAMDKMRLEMARESLENEMRSKYEGKLSLQEQLRDSWERTQNTNKLQKKIERLRRFGDDEIIESENESDSFEKDEVIRRYDRIIGKKNRMRKSSDAGLEKEVLRKERSKSVLSSVSKASKKEVKEKISRLSEKEDQIKKEKLEIFSYLESKTNSKTSSRPVTVNSLLSQSLNKKIESK